VYHAAVDEVAFTGFVFGCLQWEWGYEHGFGVVAHRGRVAYFGFAEAADESEAIKDIRRTKRRRS
jgi:hypothetical protein